MLAQRGVALRYAELQKARERLLEARPLVRRLRRAFDELPRVIGEPVKRLLPLFELRGAAARALEERLEPRQALGARRGVGVALEAQVGQKEPPLGAVALEVFKDRPLVLVEPELLARMHRRDRPAQGALRLVEQRRQLGFGRWRRRRQPRLEEAGGSVKRRRERLQGGGGVGVDDVRVEHPEVAPRGAALV